MHCKFNFWKRDDLITIQWLIPKNDRTPSITDTAMDFKDSVWLLDYFFKYCPQMPYSFHRFFFFFQITKRNVQNLEVFNLEQIQLLSERCLVNFFSDLTSNEITRNFIFTCALMPDKCQVQYKSFGNETQARLRMKKHLNAHIQDLLKEQNGEYMHNIY